VKDVAVRTGEEPMSLHVSIRCNSNPLDICGQLQYFPGSCSSWCRDE